MIGMVFAAVLTAAPVESDVPRPPPLRKAVAAPEAPTHRKGTPRRAPARPDLSGPIDVYRSEPAYAPRKFDPQHPSLAPDAEAVEGAERGFAPVSPIPPDPWAPTVPPLEPAGGVRPPSAG